MKQVWDVLFHSDAPIAWKIYNLTAKSNKSSNGISEKLADNDYDNDNEAIIEDLRKSITKFREHLNIQIKQTGALFKEIFDLIEAQKTDLTLMIEKRIQDTNLKQKIQQDIKLKQELGKF